MKLISLDWDDFLYDLMELNIEYVKEKFGEDVLNNINSYYWLWENYPTIMEDLWNNPKNYIKGNLFKGSLEFYQKLKNELGTDKIQIVTSSCRDVIEEKNLFIRSLGFDCEIVHSVFGGEFPKHFYTYGTVLIDDHVDNIVNHCTHNSYFGIVVNHRHLPYIKEKALEVNQIYTETFEGVFEKLKEIGVLKENNERK